MNPVENCGIRAMGLEEALEAHRSVSPALIHDLFDSKLDLDLMTSDDAPCPTPEALAGATQKYLEAQQKITDQSGCDINSDMLRVLRCNGKPSN